MATEEQTSYNAIDGVSGTGGHPRVGQRLTITNRIVTKISFPLSKYASPTGNVTFTIRKVSDDSIVVSKVWGDASALPTYPTIQWKEATFDTPTIVNEEVIMSLEFSGGDAGNQIFANFQNTDVKASEYWGHYITSWTWNETRDFAYIYTYTAPTAPTVTTQAVTSISGTTATGNGNITNLGTPNPTAHGVCWNTTGTPTTANSYTDEGAVSATGAFTTAMEELTAGTKYYVRAYATSGGETGYGNQVEFTADKGTVFPINPLLRASGVRRTFWSGLGGLAVYQLELALGGTTTSYVSPIGSREIPSAVTPSAVTDPLRVDIFRKPPITETGIPGVTMPFTTTMPTATQMAEYAGMGQAEYDKIIRQGEIAEALQEFGPITGPGDLTKFKERYPQLGIGEGIPKIGTPEYIRWALGYPEPAKGTQSAGGARRGRNTLLI